MKKLFGLLSLCVLAACGKPGAPTDPLVGVRPDEFVVKARSEFQVSVNTAAQGARRSNASVSILVTVSLAAATNFSVDNSAFVPPTITNAVMDFGKVKISALMDNNLKVCGAGGNQPCGNALMRIFTSGVSGAGIFNAADNFGAPLTATLTSPLTVGLGSVNAAVMQSISIPASKKVVRLSDFSPTPEYTINADFTDAGAGSYTTTIVVEYALAP